MGSKIPLKENKTAGLAEEAESKGVEAVLKDLLAEPREESRKCS